MTALPFVIGTAGHIDHGKTALVHALTGIDTDRLAVEKARGITTELGFAHLDLAEFIEALGEHGGKGGGHVLNDDDAERRRG